MIKIAGGILLAVFSLWIIAVVLQLLPVLVLFLPEIRAAITPSGQTVGIIAFYVVSGTLGLKLINSSVAAPFRKWLADFSPIERPVKNGVKNLSTIASRITRRSRIRLR